MKVKTRQEKVEHKTGQDKNIMRERWVKHRQDPENSGVLPRIRLHCSLSSHIFSILNAKSFANCIKYLCHATRLGLSPSRTAQILKICREEKKRKEKRRITERRKREKGTREGPVRGRGEEGERRGEIVFLFFSSSLSPSSSSSLLHPSLSSLSLLCATQLKDR